MAPPPPYNGRVLWIAIGAGGAFGAMARHGVNHLLHGRFLAFPAGIFVVNALGCLAIGLFAGLVASSRLHVGELGRSFVVVGLLGGFTTFSSYGLDTLTLARGGHTGLALANGLGQVALGLTAVWLGFSVGSWRP
jgi:fluoride exporter